MSLENEENVIEEVVIAPEGEELGEKEEPEEIPVWMQEESDDDEEGKQTSSQVPVGALIGVKDKLRKSKKEKLDLEAENKRLKEQLQGNKAPAPADPPKRPRSADFSTDEEHEAALEKYDVEIADYRLNLREQDRSRSESARSAQQKTAQAVDKFYDMAEEVVKKHKIDPDVYRSATDKVQAVVENAFPKLGKKAFDLFLASMEEGDEATLYFIGRSDKQLDTLAGKLADDPSGVKAFRHIARITERNANAGNKRTQAPKPGTQHNGDGKPVTAKEKTFKKAYASAGTAQERYDARKAAKAAGFDPTKWS